MKKFKKKLIVNIQFKHRSIKSKSTYVFSSSETAIKIGRQINRGRDNYLSSTYDYIDGNEKRVSYMTTLSLVLSFISPQANVVRNNAF